MKTYRFLLMLLITSFLFTTCGDDDDFGDQTFDSDQLRVLKVSLGDLALSADVDTIPAFGLDFEVIFSSAVDTDAITSALSISNGASFETSFDETSSIMTLSIDQLDYETEYTLALPAGNYGADGEALGEDYASSFYTLALVTPAVTLSANMSSIEEGASTYLIATLNQITSEDVTVNLNVGGTATSPDDYSLSANSITVSKLKLKDSIEISSIDDVVVEGAEFIQFDIESLTNAVEEEDQSVSITLVDNDVFTDLTIKGVMALRWTSEPDGNAGKAIHLKATADIPDLSVYGIGVANNGGGSDGIEFQLPVMAASEGDDILIARNQTDLGTYFGDLSPFEIVLDGNSSVSHNGNDAIELFSGSVVIETYGDANVDGDTEDWNYTGSWAYKLGGSYIYGGIGCTDTSSPNTTQESNCTYPSYLPALQIQGLMSFEIESLDRAIHLRANADIPDLSVFGVGIPNNGGPTDGEEVFLPSISVAEGEHILLIRDADVVTIGEYLGSCYSQFDHKIEDGGINFNGDDPVELYENGSVVEYYGSIDGVSGEYEDGTGLMWEYTGSWAIKLNGDVYTYGGINCTTAGTTNATSACSYPFCD